MTQEQRLECLIHLLLNENPEYRNLIIPEQEYEKKKLLRSLMNIRMPEPISKEFLDVQDIYLQEELRNQKVVSIADLIPVKKGIYLWKGDITKLKVDAIVNAGNSALLGCFIPCHGCIDNAIHSLAGIQLRLECQRIMAQQGSPEPTGKAKITKGYNLPAKYILHTVGPIVQNSLTRENRHMLASCYASCLELAEQYHLKSIAFCCISTGEFHFPNEIAGQIAIDTVTSYLNTTHSEMEVVFNVFQDNDLEIYQRLLGTDQKTKK